MFDRILDQVASIRDEYLKLQGNALDQMELYAAQGHAKETSAFSSEAERHGAAILACKRILAILEAQPAPPQGEACQQEPVAVKPLDERDYREIFAAARASKIAWEKKYAPQDMPVQSSFDWWVMKETEARIRSALVASPPAQAVPDEHQPWCRMSGGKMGAGCDCGAQAVPEGCARCGFPRKEHSYNGACYGICGEFIGPTGTASPAGEDATT